MAKNVIPAGKDFSYRGKGASRALELHKWIVFVSDSLKNRIAKHSYLKRDGAEKEPMGADDGIFRVRLAIVGDENTDAPALYRSIAQYLRRYPQGTLTHPLLGDLQVASEGVDEGSIDIANAFNAINLSLTFSEDALNAAIAASDYVGPSEEAGTVTTKIAALQTAAAPFTSAATSIASIATKAAALATNALTAWSTLTPDPSIGVLLGQVAASASTAESEIKSDTGADNDGARFDAISSTRETHAACIELQYAISRTSPPLVTYTVPATTTVGAIAALLYGKDGRSRIDEILTYNRIANPSAIPGGTKLLVAQPTVT